MTTETETRPEPRYTSNSALNQHRTCPQQYTYRRLRKIERIPGDDPKVELEMGNWWHALRAANSIDRGRKHGTLQAFPEELGTVDGGPRISTEESTNSVESRVWGEATRWWDAQNAAVKDEWTARIGQGMPDRLLAMDRIWWDRWEKQIENERPLAVEFWWERPLPSLTDGTDPNTIEVGVIDEVYLDTAQNMVVIRDHKSHKKIGEEGTAENMMDSQLQVYAWGASKVIASWGFGPVRAVAYDRIRMTAGKEPKITQMGGLSATVKDYDLNTYLEWVQKGQTYPGRKKDGSQSGTYVLDQGVVDHLKSPDERAKWARRSLAPLNMHVVKTHLRSAVDAAIDVSKTVARFEEQGDAARNFGGACRWCDYTDLCRAEMLGGPDGDYDLAAMNLRQKEQK